MRRGKGTRPAKTRLYLLILALAANLVLFTGPGAGGAYACSCAGTWSTEESYRRADAVFSGEVVEVEESPAPSDGTTTLAMPRLNPVSFDVGEAWKGVSGDAAIVYGEGPEVSCGIDFDRGETYLVFAYNSREAEDSPLQADFCGATEQVDVETARQMLGPPATLPETGGVSPKHAQRGPNEAYAAVTTVFAALAAGVFLARGLARGRKRRDGPL